jgi:hypothetical protein
LAQSDPDAILETTKGAGWKKVFLLDYNFRDFFTFFAYLNPLSPSVNPSILSPVKAVMEPPLRVSLILIFIFQKD